MPDKVTQKPSADALEFINKKKKKRNERSKGRSRAAIKETKFTFTILWVI